MRPLVLLALAGLSLVVLAGISLSGGSDTQAQSTTIIEVGDLWFCDPGDSACMSTDDDDDAATIVTVGDTVVWQWGPGGAGTGESHTTTNCADNFTVCSGPREWDSADLFQTSGTFSHTFGPEDAGKTFLYLCQVHPQQMRGQITVLSAAEPSPTVVTTPGPTPTPSAEEAVPSPTAVQPSEVPAGGGQPAGESGGSAFWPLALAGGGVLVAASSLVLLRATRR